MSSAIELNLVVPVDASIGPDASIANCFRAVAAANPGAMALTSPSGRFTYADIDRWSDAIALDIIQKNAPVDRPLAIVTATNVPLVPAAFAAVKAGHFYLTIDSSEPDERIAMLLRESNAGLCLVETGKDVPAALRGCPLVEIGDPPVERPPLPPHRPPHRFVNLVYTSGTTGKPKGIVSKQSGFVNSTLRSNSRRDRGPGERVMFKVLPGFARANTILGPLLAGATLCAFDSRETLTALAEYIRREQITHLALTPAVFRRLMRALPPELDLSKVTKLRCGADIVTIADVEAFKKHFPRGCILEHGYASSETGGRVLSMRIDHDTPIPGPLVPMGRPHDDAEVWLRDEEGNEVPTGEVGEVVVRSADVIEGYFNMPDSAARFVPDPERPGVRTFHTGDLAMRDADGLYYFAGRKDFRLRIHNRRIDPLQIEPALLAAGDVREAVVVGKADDYGEQRLVAYVVMDIGKPCVPRAIRKALRAKLPTWMIPARIYELDAMPVTPGAGKVDRTALVTRVDPQREQESGAADDLERRLVEIWSRVIGVPVHVEDDFFDDLGAESVVAAHLVTEIEQQLGRAIPLSLVVEVNTVQKMAAWLRTRTTQPLAILIQQGVGNNPPLYAVAGGGGSVVRFRNVAQAIGAELTMYGMQPHGFDRANFPRTHTEILEAYAAAIRQIQPAGPYYLAGYSGGGTMAFNLARYFEVSGQRVAFVGLIDSGVNATRVGLWKRLVHRVSRLTAPRGLLYSAIEFRNRIRRAVRQRLRRQIVDQGKPLPAWLGETRRKRRGARRDFSLGPYSGRVTLFRARNGLVKVRAEPDLGWTRFAPGGVEIIDVDGAHESVMDPPQVASLGAAMKRALAQAMQ